MRYTRIEQSEHLMQQIESGQTIATYCREHSINYHTFLYWRRKHKDDRNTEPGTNSSRPFIEMSFAPPNAPFSGITIYLPNGVRIQLAGKLDGGLLELLSHV